MTDYQFCKTNHLRTESNTVYIKGRIQCKICYQEEKEEVQKKELLDEFMRRLDSYVEVKIRGTESFGRGKFPEQEMLRRTLNQMFRKERKDGKTSS